MRNWMFIAMSAVAAAGCGSPTIDQQDSSKPAAPPIAQELNQAAKAATAAAEVDPHSPSRVLGYVEGEVITYRDVAQKAGPQLAQFADSPADKARAEDDALMQLVLQRLLYRAALDAGIQPTRDQLDAQRSDFARDLAKNGGTIDAYLHEHDMSRHELDETLKRELVVDKFTKASLGRNEDPHVHVRPVTDIYVAPDDVVKYYERHLEKFHAPATARCRMLAVQTDTSAHDREKAVAEAKAKADAILARLRKGEDWVPVYREFMAAQGKPDVDPKAPDGLIEMGRGKWLDPFDSFAFGSAKGVMTVVQQGTTFWVLRAEGAREERTVPLAEAAPEIRNMLGQARTAMAWLEVQLSVLDESSVQPDALRSRLRGFLRQARQKIGADAGI